MGLNNEMLKQVLARYGPASRLVPGIKNVDVSLWLIDMMLELRAMYHPPKYGKKTWCQVMDQMLKPVRTMLAAPATQVVVAVFDRPFANVAKFPEQESRKRAEDGVSAEDDVVPTSWTHSIPTHWDTLMLSRSWRQDVLIPATITYMRNNLVVPPRMHFIIDAADPLPFYLTAAGASPLHSTHTYISLQCPEADFQMLYWLQFPAFKEMSAGVYSRDGDELAALLLFYPTNTPNRPLYWVKLMKTKAHMGQYTSCCINRFAELLAKEFLVFQTVLRLDNADAGAEIADFLTVFVAILLSRGSDYTKLYDGITFEVHLCAYFMYIKQHANFVYAVIDPETQQRTLMFSYELYRQYINCCYGLKKKYDPTRLSLEQARLDVKRKLPSEETVRFQAAQLTWALQYFANAWNPHATIPNVLERMTDPADETGATQYSRYGLELADVSAGVTPKNVVFATQVIV